jgi:hypothetical protein
MNVLMWKKIKELSKKPVNLLIFLLIPSALLILYNKVFHINLLYIFQVLPLISCCFSTIMIFNVEDITYLSWYNLLGIKTRTVWLQNLLFIIIFQFIVTEITLIAFAYIYSVDINWYTILVNLSMIIIAICLIGLSTIHFSSNGKISVIIASVFALVNMASPVIPIALFSLEDVIKYDVIYTVLVFASLIAFLSMYIYMGVNRGEDLINNTQIYTGGYNDKFFGED